MVGKLGVLVFLLGCHPSPPTVSPASGGGETATATPIETPVAPEPLPPQNAAPQNLPLPPPSRSPTPASDSPSKPAPSVTDRAPDIGEKCGPGDACADGLTCVSYYGIMGTRGPQFRTCEARCDRKQRCPSGRSCVTVSDGPGRVCR
jgi:hypothetical protein